MRHPEQAEDEIYLGNDDDQSFNACGWTTKRQGKTPRDRQGRPLRDSLFVKSCKPTFIKRSEIEAKLLITHDDDIRRIYQSMLDHGHVSFE